LPSPPPPTPCRCRLRAARAAVGGARPWAARPWQAPAAPLLQPQRRPRLPQRPSSSWASSAYSWPPGRAALAAAAALRGAERAPLAQ
jgi:hypothetical protein